jgi:hypothetical protein
MEYTDGGRRWFGATAAAATLPAVTEPAVTEPPRRVRFRRLRFGAPEAVVVLALGAAVVAVARPGRAAREAVAREEAALAALRRYAGVLSAHATGLEARPPAQEGAPLRTHPDFARAGLAPPEPAGYRFDVLLPGRALRDGRVAWVTDPALADPARAGRRFAVVARPRARGDGLRSFHLDDAGTLWVAEGVMDYEEKDFPPLPESTFVGSEDDAQPGTFWRRVEAPRSAP